MEKDDEVGFWRMVRRLQSTNGVASILATMIAGTICVRYLINQDVDNLPPVLAHSLSVILGFYFGSKAVRSSN